MDREDLAWAAGFFDGEGSVGCYSNDSRHQGKPYLTLRISISQKDKRVLERFKTIFGCGAISGPIRVYVGRRGAEYRFKDAPGTEYGYKYIYNLYGHEAVKRVIAKMWCWLDDVKREQARAALCTYKPVRKLTRTLVF